MSTGPSLYRRHRPRTFADVVGQEQIVRTLSNAVTRNKVHHAYLFVGSRGTGKTSTAKILAACLNCTGATSSPTIEPCGVCDACVSIARATSLDVIEMDAASNNSVDDIRDLREKVAYSPVSGGHKVYILDEAHMLSSQAWNAFLKTLEEPPPRTIFVLATTEAQKVLPTVVDRCHRFDFGRPTVEQVARVVSRVATTEQIEIDPGAVALIARHATGSFRDALGTLEQLVTYSGDEPIGAGDVLAVLGVADAEQLFESVDAVQARDPAQALRTAARLTATGRDPGQILRDLEVHARELLTVQILEEVPEELRITPERDARLLTQAEGLTGADVVRLLDLVAAALEATANGAQPRIQLELVLIKAASPELDPSTAALLARIERLENDLAARSEPVERAAGATRPERAEPDERAERAEPPERPEPVVTRTLPATQAARAQPQVVAPPVTAPPVPGEDELDTLVSSWPAVIELLSQQNKLLASSLAAARPVALNEQGLTLAFPTGREFYKRKAEQDESRRATAEALRTVIGTAVALRYEVRDEAELRSDRSAVLSQDDLVRRLVAEFDAEEVLDDDPNQEEA